MYPSDYAKYALHTMYAHRLWTKLWISLGHPEENPTRPGGNARVTRQGILVAHSRTSRPGRIRHSQCAQRQRHLAGRIGVIPGIHHPYDDYQFGNGRQIQIKAGKCPADHRVRNETPTR